MAIFDTIAAVANELPTVTRTSGVTGPTEADREVAKNLIKNKAAILSTKDKVIQMMFAKFPDLEKLNVGAVNGLIRNEHGVYLRRILDNDGKPVGVYLTEGKPVNRRKG